jgi:DNA-binding LacI/PurR family transcriptional regulator
MEINPGFHVNTLSGYMQAMEDAGFAVLPSWIQSGAYDEASSYACMERILHGDIIPTAVFCSSDVFAYSSMLCARDHGYSIPDDISFFGMDDIQLSKYTQPALSTLSIDEAYMGKAAMQLIDKMVSGEEYDSIILASNTITERASVKDLKAIEKQT